MRRLNLLGASVRAAAQSAGRAGLAPYAIDCFADRDLAALCPAVRIERYPGGLVAALAAAPDAPWMYTGGLENHPRLVDRLAAIRPLLGNGGAVLRAVRDPSRLAGAVREAGCAFPELALPAGTERFSAAPSCRGAADGVWLVKRRRSSGGLAVRFAAPADWARLWRRDYLQRYIDGQAASAVYVAASGRAMLLGVSRQLLGRDFGLDRPFLFAGSIAPLPLAVDETAKLQALGDVLVERFSLVGLFNVDFVRTADAIWPVEVNPRYSASAEVLERVSGGLCLALHVTACEGGKLGGSLALPFLTAPASSTMFAGKAIVYAAGGVIVPPRFAELVSAWNQRGEWPGVADLPPIGQRLAAGQPIATVFAAGQAAAEVEAELRRRTGAVTRALTGA